jgi:hypothetical protein
MKFQILKLEGMDGLIICPRPLFGVSVFPLEWEHAVDERDAIGKFLSHAKYRGCQLYDVGKSLICSNRNS